MSDTIVSPPPLGMTSPVPGAIPEAAEAPEVRELSHPNWPVWNCNFEPVREEKAWTVGEKQLMKCEGESITPISKVPEFLFQIETQTYSLHGLELRKSDANSVELVVTGYKPGKHDYKWIEVADGENGFRIENTSIELQSLIPPNEPQQPNMNVGALEMGYPLWMWLSLVLIVLVPSLLFIQKLRRKAEIKKLVESLAQSNSALRPYDQFSKDMRGLVRAYNYHAKKELAVEFTQKLNELFKTYLTRAFRLPALVWSPGTFVNEIKRRHGKTYKEILPDLKNAMLEINKTETSGKASPEDADQLKKIAMVLSERIFKAQEEKASR